MCTDAGTTTTLRLTVKVGGTPISGWVDDNRGRHRFAGWLELVSLVAAAKEQPVTKSDDLAQLPPGGAA